MVNEVIQFVYKKIATIVRWNAKQISYLPDGE